ncbi:MAG: amidohydrolase [Candidatus Omnitrophica bacterium]|nr:amidohydrolase [Candidatus Omnitrophota bacterium]
MIRVDMHLHLGKSIDGAEISASQIQAFLSEYGFSHAVVFPIDEPNPGPSYSRSNQKVAAFAKKDKRIIPFCRLNPHYLKESCEELQRTMRLGFRGVKLHPRSESFYPHHAEDLFHAIEKARLPVVIHTAHEHHSHPILWEGIFLRHRKISFILAHAGKDAYRDAAAIALKYPNVYLDSATVSFRRTQYLIQKVGPGKLVFASDSPYSHPAVESLKYELLLKGNPAAMKKIFEENPKKILGGLP